MARARAREKCRFNRHEEERFPAPLILPSLTTALDVLTDRREQQIMAAAKANYS
jgi:hypothetical protein